MKSTIRKWVKQIFHLYDIEDLAVGGTCGLCGKWIEKKIFDKAYRVGTCKKCEKKEGEK